jgi:hypothetical protein
VRSNDRSASRSSNRWSPTFAGCERHQEDAVPSHGRRQHPADALIAVHGALQPQKLDYDQADIYLRVTTKSELFRCAAAPRNPSPSTGSIATSARGSAVRTSAPTWASTPSLRRKKPNGAARRLQLRSELRQHRRPVHEHRAQRRRRSRHADAGRAVGFERR